MDMDSSDIKSKVIEMLSESFVIEHIDIDLLQYADLLDDLGMDSLIFIAIVVEVEDTFGIIIPDEKLQMENFRNVDSIVQIINDALIYNANEEEDK